MQVSFKNGAVSQDESTWKFTDQSVIAKVYYLDLDEQGCLGAHVIVNEGYIGIIPASVVPPRFKETPDEMKGKIFNCEIAGNYDEMLIVRPLSEDSVGEENIYTIGKVFIKAEIDSKKMPPAERPTPE